jgi:xylulose-5-phosphate/fructose-6-phosphate phosphoketolase
MNVPTVDASIEVVAARDDAPVAATPDLLRHMHAYWQAANTVALGQARSSASGWPAEPRASRPADSTVVLNLVYVHLNRLIRDYELSMILVAGGRGGAAALEAQRYLEGLSVERRCATACHGDGLSRVPNPRTARHERHDPVAMPRRRKTAETGRSLLHAYGAAFESPELIVACFVEDAHAEAGLLAAGWHGNALLDAKRDGAVLPILHRGEGAPACLSDDALVSTLRAQGYEPSLVACDDSARMHQTIAETLDAMLDCIDQIQSHARSAGGALPVEQPRWPMLILQWPQGWTGPAVVDDSARTVEQDAFGFSDSSVGQQASVTSLGAWIKSRAPNACFDERGALRAELAMLTPKKSQCLGFNAYIDDGSPSAFVLPELHRYAVIVNASDDMLIEGQRVLDTCLGDLDALQDDSQSSFYFATEESLPMRLSAIAGACGGVQRASCGDDGSQKGCDDLAIQMLVADILKEWQADDKTSDPPALHACYDAFIQALEHRLTQQSARPTTREQAVPSGFNDAVESTVTPLSLPSRNDSIDAMVALKQPLDRAHAETSAGYALTRSGLESIACACGLIHSEAYACGEPQARHKRSVAEFEVDEVGDRHDAAHGSWSY